MQAAAGHAAHPHTSRLGDRCETETEGSVEHNTLHVGAGNCNLRTLQQRDGGQVFGFKGLNDRVSNVGVGVVAGIGWF